MVSWLGKDYQVFCDFGDSGLDLGCDLNDFADLGWIPVVMFVILMILVTVVQALLVIIGTNKYPNAEPKGHRDVHSVAN